MSLILATLALAGCGTPPAKDGAEPTARVATPAPPQPAAQQAAATPALQPVAATADAAADDNEIICRKEKTLGTRIGKQVCKSRAQFRLEEESARQMMKNRDNKSHGVTDPITGGN